MPAAPRKPSGVTERTVKTREEWLAEVASAMRQWFDDLDFPLPILQIRSGFPSTGRRGRSTAESWTQDDGQSYVIFVRPDRPDPVEVAAAIAHQLCQIAAGPKDNHGHLFRHLAISIGLRGGRTEAPPGLIFRELIAPIIQQAGTLPNTTLESASSRGAAKQTARLVKVTCGECGYVARVARKWLHDVGAPLCPLHGQMTFDDLSELP